MSLQSTINLNVNATAGPVTAPDIGTVNYALALAPQLAVLSTGAGLNQGDYVWSDTRSLNASTAENIDMYAPSARDVLGQTLTLAKIKLLYVKNKGGAVLSASDILKIGGEGSAAAWNSIFDASDTAKTSLQPDGALLLVAPSAAGYAVANGSNHLLKFENTNGSQAITYDIVIIGA